MVVGSGELNEWNSSTTLAIADRILDAINARFKV